MTAPIVARDYKEFVAALTYWRRRRGLSQVAVDELAGMHLGYCGKLENPDGLTRKGKRYGKRAVHPSFDWWLGGVGVVLVVVPAGHIRRRAAPDPRQLDLFDWARVFNHVRFVSHGDTDCNGKVLRGEKAPPRPAPRLRIREKPQPAKIAAAAP